MPVKQGYSEVGVGYLGIHSKGQVAGHMVTDENLARLDLTVSGFGEC